MASHPTREEAEAYAARWRLVEERALAELRSTTPQQKFEQLASLMASARAFDWATTDLDEVEAVRTRWHRLRACYGG